MSIRLVLRVRDTRGIPPGPKAVLSDLATYADDDGRNAFPAVERIASDLGYANRSSIDRHLRWLRSNGYLKVVQPGGGIATTHYQIRLECLSTLVSRDKGVLAPETRGIGSRDKGVLAPEANNTSGNRQYSSENRSRVPARDSMERPPNISLLRSKHNFGEHVGKKVMHCPTCYPMAYVS